jgi:glutamate dehydrogenase/leucine dehydrogenase
MTLKYGLLGLPQGGAKAGVRGDADAPLERRRERLAAFARQIEPLLRARIYVPDSDMGTGSDDIRWMLRSIGFRMGRREWRGSRSGHYTAVSCVGAAEAALAHRELPMSGCRVAIEGFGSVGSSLAALLAARGARIVAISTSRGAVHDPRGLDVDDLLRRAALSGSAVVDEPMGAERLERSRLLELDVDLLCPCARRHGIHEGNVARVRAGILCPGANEPWSPESEQALRERGVLCIPDFVSNSGGVLGGTMDFAAVHDATIETLVAEHVRGEVAILLERAERLQVSPTALAQDLARRRFETVAASQRNPGLRGRIFALGLELYRRGWIPRTVAGAAAPSYFRGSLAALRAASRRESGVAAPIG